MKRRLSVLGAGSWGTALAVHLGRAGFRVQLWARRRELVEEISSNRTNPTYLPDVLLPDSVEVSADLSRAARNDLVLVVVPSHGYRQALREFLACRTGDDVLTVVSATKGIETETIARMSQVTAEEATAAGQKAGFAVLSGPTFAAELAAGTPSAAVVASADEALASKLQESISTPGLRLYSSTDVVGVELGGTAKNVVAVAAGMVSGLGLGHNTLAALITRGLHEMTRLGVACGGERRTFSGLAGLGDLVLTCTGGLSRNRRTGLELAAGKTLEQIERETTMVAEGVRNSLSISRLAAGLEVDIPITREIVGVLYEGRAPKEAVERLMTRELKSETLL